MFNVQTSCYANSEIFLKIPSSSKQEKHLVTPTLEFFRVGEYSDAASSIDCWNLSHHIQAWWCRLLYTKSGMHKHTSVLGYFIFWLWQQSLLLEWCLHHQSLHVCKFVFLCQQALTSIDIYVLDWGTLMEKDAHCRFSPICKPRERKKVLVFIKWFSPQNSNVSKDEAQPVMMRI